MDVGLENIGVYINRKQSNVAQYISTGTIFDIAVEKDQRNGSPALLQWWEQAEIWFGDGGEVEMEGGGLELG